MPCAQNGQRLRGSGSAYVFIEGYYEQAIIQYFCYESFSINQWKNYVKYINDLQATSYIIFNKISNMSCEQGTGLA